MGKQQGVESRFALAPVGLMFVIASTLGTSAQAQVELTGGLDSRFTDNASKASRDEQSDLESRVYLKADYASDPGRCNATFSGTLGYSNWLDSTFDDEAYGEMDFLGDCELANQLYWDVANTLREVTQSSRSSDTPDNRTRKNVFSTGPRYNWRINDTNWLTLSTRYENTEFSEGDTSDTERYLGAAAWNHAFSKTFNGGVSANYSRTEYDTGAEVDVRTVNLTFGRNWPTMDVSGAIGVSEIETKAGSSSQSSDGLVGELSIQRALTPSSDWYLRAAHQLTDRSSNVDFVFENFQFSLEDSITVETTTVSTGFDNRFSNGATLNVEFYGSQSDYIDDPEREDGGGVNFRYGRPMAERTTGHIGLGYDYLTYASDELDERITRVEVGAEHEASRDLSLTAKVGHQNKVSDAPTSEYDENWVLVGLEYRFR